jgi:hypothetical protein
MISVQKVFKQDQCAKVCGGSDDAKNDCQPIGWRDEDLWYFHSVWCQRRLTGINLWHHLVGVHIILQKKERFTRIPYSTKLAEQE